MHEITLLIDESEKEMAYQLLALAIKKKYKDRIRPCYPMYSDDGLKPTLDIRLQNDLWLDDSGQPFDL